MTEKTSPHKVSRMLELYFQGYSQSDIAEKINVNQSTVSLHINRFKTMADKQGLEISAKEYGIMDALKSLHSLAVELRQAKLTVEEAKAGLRVHRVFQKCGVDEQKYNDLIEACYKMHSDGFLDSAVKLNQLQKSTGLGYEDAISGYQTAINQLKETKHKLVELTTKIKAWEAVLASIDKKKELTTKELNSYMEKVGLDMKRLQMVESFAVALKKANVGDDELGNYLKYQIELNKAGISLSTFAEILNKVKVLTTHDQGRELLKMLVQYGSLAETTKELQSRINELQKETSVLEGQRRLKEEIEHDIARLKAEKASLEKSVAYLSKEKQTFAQLQKDAKALNDNKVVLEQDIIVMKKYKQDLSGEIQALEKKTSHLKEIEHNIARLKAENVALEKSVAYLAKEKETFAQLQKDAKALNDNKIVLQQDIIVMEKYKQDLSGEIQALEKKTSDLKEIEAKHHSLSSDIAEMGVKINSSQTQLDVLQSFLGFIEASSSAQIDKFVSQLPDLLADARQKNYSPEFLRDYILETLTGGTLRTLVCTSCNTRFTVDTPSKYSFGYYCPVCFRGLVKVVQHEATILKATLAEPAPKRWIPTRVCSQDTINQAQPQSVVKSIAATKDT